MYKIVSLIPARGNSKGVPLKNLHPINGKPLISYMLDVSISSKHIGQKNTYVITDHQEIRKFAEGMGVNVMTEPAELAKDDVPLDKVIEYFTWNATYDIIALLQPTSPMLDVADLDRALDTYLKWGDVVKEGGYDSIFSTITTDDILIWDYIKFKPINYDPKNREFRQTRLSDYVIETGAFFITSRRQFEHSGCRIGQRPGFLIVDYWTSFQVDSIKDAQMIEKLMR